MFICFLGKSSVGKSLLFENVVLHTAHQLLSSSSSSSSDAGVGRFQTGSKNTVIFHDINIGTLLGAGNIFCTSYSSIFLIGRHCFFAIIICDKDIVNY